MILGAVHLELNKINAEQRILLYIDYVNMVDMATKTKTIQIYLNVYKWQAKHVFVLEYYYLE